MVLHSQFAVKHLSKHFNASCVEGQGELLLVTLIFLDGCGTLAHVSGMSVGHTEVSATNTPQLHIFHDMQSEDNGCCDNEIFFQW